MLGARDTEMTKTLSSYSFPTFIKIYFSEMLLDVALKSLCFENRVEHIAGIFVDTSLSRK